MKRRGASVVIVAAVLGIVAAAMIGPRLVPDTIRHSIGIEHIDDTIGDIDQALEASAA